MLFQFSFQSIGGASLVWALAWGIAPGRSWPRRRMPSTTKTHKQLNRMLPAPIRSSDLDLFHRADAISQQRPCLAIATGSYWMSSKDGHGSRVGSVAGSYIQPDPEQNNPLVYTSKAPSQWVPVGQTSCSGGYQKQASRANYFFYLGSGGGGLSWDTAKHREVPGQVRLGDGTKWAFVLDF